ncbi:hypothetical protein E4U31_004869 [Claviceps sp. LM219 group G6]|nr:hypothetical protein E4U31_004869 [Claviceps sp. LM219 group G6]KAG6108848.1 hypothetical protein E4U14_003450 [Claviceps sp. LM454 group G7]
MAHRPTLDPPLVKPDNVAKLPPDFQTDHGPRESFVPHVSTQAIKRHLKYGKTAQRPMLVESTEYRLSTE